MSSYFHWMGPDQVKELRFRMEKHTRILYERKEDMKAQISKFIDQDTSKDNDHYREKMMNQIIIKLQDELDSLNKLIEMQSEMNRLVNLFSLYQYYSNTDCPLCKHIEINKTPVTA